MFSRSALQTTAICRFSLHERTTDIIVPATEEFCHHPHFLTKYIIVYIICFFVFYISNYFINTQVEALTNGQIEFNRYGNNHSRDIVWIGILFGLLHRFYEKAVELKKSMS